MKVYLWLSLCLVLIGCGQPPKPQTISIESSSQFSRSLYIEFYSHAAAGQSKLLVEQTKILQEAVTAFLAEPKLNNLHTAQRGWLSAHQSFLKADFFVSAADPSLAEEETSGSKALITMIDAWPIQEGFLDSLQQYPASGIINDLTLTIDAQTLRNQHGITAAEEVSLGFHAIEFMLWSRLIADFTKQNNLTASQQNNGLMLAQLSNNRRRKTLRLLSKLLHEDVVGRYQPLLGEERQPATADMVNVRGAIQDCIRTLRSIRRELLLIAEDESSGHSRFSNNSVQDLLTYMQALVFVYAGPGRLHELFESLDAELAGQFRTLVDATLQKLTDLPESKLEPPTLLELNRSLDIMIDHSQQIDSMLGS